MRNTLAIAGKELRVYFTTWTSYILLGAFMLISAFFFQALVREYQEAAVQYMRMQAQWMSDQMNLTDLVMGNLLRNMAVFLLFMLPILTMRLVAEERRTKTLELLLTSPVRPWEVVLGKYLAAFSMLVVMLAITLVFPLLLQLFGASSEGSPLDWHTVLAGYLGLLLMGAAFLGVGLAASAVTESQVVAVVVSFALLLMLFVVGYAAGQGAEGFWPALGRYISLTTHLEDFVRGLIRVSAVVYYVSLAFVGLFLTYRVVEAHRWR